MEFLIASVLYMIDVLLITGVSMDIGGVCGNRAFSQWLSFREYVQSRLWLILDLGSEFVFIILSMSH